MTVEFDNYCSRLGTEAHISAEAQKYPPNINTTKEEIVEINGKKFVKSTEVYKHTGENDTMIFQEHESLRPLQ